MAMQSAQPRSSLGGWFGLEFPKCSEVSRDPLEDGKELSINESGF